MGLKQRLLLDGVVYPLDVPSKSAISKCMKKELHMTKKKIHQLPAESKRDENVELRDDFLNIIANLEPGSIHCFESSVIKTTSNRRYGNSPMGKPAYEIKRTKGIFKQLVVEFSLPSIKTNQCMQSVSFIFLTVKNKFQRVTMVLSFVVQRVTL